MVTKKQIHSTETIQLYEAILNTLPKVVRKGAAMPYTSHNGHMFSFLNKEGKLGLRLDEKEREAFIKKYKTTLCFENGIILKEYVYVPDKLFKNTEEVSPYFKKSLKYIAALKPKK